MKMFGDNRQIPSLSGALLLMGVSSGKELAQTHNHRWSAPVGGGGGTWSCGERQGGTRMGVAVKGGEQGGREREGQ